MDGEKNSTTELDTVRYRGCCFYLTTFVRTSVTLRQAPS